MDANKETVEKSESVRRQTIELLEQLETKAREFELPAPPEAMERYREKLFGNSYKVLVLGEAKRGKSTFINALIGQDILPTDVDIATSQVFRVSHSEREAYRLRFEDETEKTITREQLSSFGSQVVQDAEGTPALDKTIRWIEVDAPVSFLPKGVSILDTPGTGGLYAAHAQITYRYVPQADAVIFVLSSDKPIIQDEINFLEQILNVTRNVFFVQTKIDLVGENWKTIHDRNVEILREKFKDRLREVKIYPISSTNLRAAADAETDDAEILLMVSRHQEMSEALQNFLFRVAGWSRAVEAVLVANQYYPTARQTLETRLAALAEETRGKVKEAQARFRERMGRGIRVGLIS